MADSLGNRGFFSCKESIRWMMCEINQPIEQPKKKYSLKQSVHIFNKYASDTCPLQTIDNRTVGIGKERRSMVTCNGSTRY